MSRTLPFVLVFSAALAGCASKPVVTDTTPQKPAAIIERHVTSEGVKGLFPFETNDLAYVRPDMRRDDSTFKGTGTFSGFLVGTHNGTRIYRLDRRLLWIVNTDKEEYTECPLAGCPVHRPPPGKAQPAQGQPEARHEAGCTMRIAKSSFDVTPTGKKQTINGFDTEEYQVEWLVTLRDPKARTSISKLGVDIWTAQPTQAMRDAMAVEAAYSRDFAAATREASDRRPQILPNEAAGLILSYLGGALNARDHDAFFRAGKKLATIKGHPIRTTLTWNITGNACAPKENGQQAKSSASTARTPTSASGLASGLAGLFAEHEANKAADETANAPLLSITVEVRQLKVEPVHDSVFTVPAGYKQVEPK